MASYTWRVTRSDTNSTLKKDKGEGGRGGVRDEVWVGLLVAARLSNG